MRAMGFELVTANGELASRVRIHARTVIAWAPIIVLMMAVPEPSPIEFAVSILLLLVQPAGPPQLSSARSAASRNGWPARGSCRAASETREAVEASPEPPR
jgi:hypothetical protein